MNPLHQRSKYKYINVGYTKASLSFQFEWNIHFDPIFIEMSFHTVYNH